MAQPVPRRSAAWQRGSPAPPPPRITQPINVNGTQAPRPPPQRLIRKPPTTPVTPTSERDTYPASDSSPASSDHAIQIRGRSRYRPSGAALSGRTLSESPSKLRHASICSRSRLFLSISCCLVTVALLLVSSFYTQREVLWDGMRRYTQGANITRVVTDGASFGFSSGFLLVSAQQPTEPIITPAAQEEPLTDAPIDTPPTPIEPTDAAPPLKINSQALAAQRDNVAVVAPSDPPTPPIPLNEAGGAPVNNSPLQPPVPSVLSYTANAVMTNSLFPKTADGYPVFSSPSSTRYSNFYCIGGRGREGSQSDRSCRWQNLCYRPADKQWLFYQDPATKGDLPILLDHGVVVSEFPLQFVNLRSMGNAPDAQYWAPTQVYAEIPAGAMVPRRKAERPDVYLLYHSHYPSNIGHVLGDDFFPLFNLQLSFNMLSNDNQLLMSRSCEDIFLPGSPSKAAACHKFMSMLSPGMSDRPYLAVTQPDLRERLGVRADAELVCFENVLTGNGPWGFQQSLGKSPSWWQYHAYYLANMGVPYNHTPRKHRITVSVKDGKRSIYNSREMVEHLRATFPAYEVDAIELYQLGGWKQELTYLLDTTVLITPCGGVSMSSMFLPHGAAMIVVDFWDVSRNNTKGMEERLWSNLGYVRPFHYPFVEAEVVLDEVGKVRTAYQDMRDWGRVRVDVARMEKIVRAAIAHVDSFMVMGQQ